MLTEGTHHQQKQDDAQRYEQIPVMNDKLHGHGQGMKLQIN
jgi:hypothetical protein